MTKFQKITIILLVIIVISLTFIATKFCWPGLFKPKGIGFGKFLEK